MSFYWESQKTKAFKIALLQSINEQLKLRIPIHERFSIEKYLFKEQLDFVNDPADFKTGLCSRRAGKTVACASDLTYTCLNFPGTMSLYITLSRSNAKKIIWPELKRINREFGLCGIPNESELSMTYPNHSIIYCSGASDKTEIEKFRGMPFKKTYIDESQSFPDYIRELVDDVISPALMDYAGSLSLIGTPGPIPAGFFYDCTQNKEWSHHSWTFQQNPHIFTKSGRSYEEILNRELKRRGVGLDNPSIQREYFAKWILDSDSLVFKYNTAVNDYHHVPLVKPVYIMGIDIGYEDSDAIAILAFDEKSPTTYLIEEQITAKQDLTSLTAQIEIFRAKYDISKCVADFGGLGKKIAAEITRRYQLPIQAADKTQKVASIELLNDALRTGRFKAKQQSRFALDSIMVEWDRDASTPEKRVVSDRFHSDICDAVLYAFKESPAYAWEPDIPKPKQGSLEWQQDQAREMEREAEEYFERMSQEAREYTI